MLFEIKEFFLRLKYSPVFVTLMFRVVLSVPANHEQRDPTLFLRHAHKRYVERLDLGVGLKNTRFV